MTEPTMVYVLSTGEYSGYVVVGVYSSLEMAEAAAPPWTNAPEPGTPGSPWVPDTLHDWRALQLEEEELEIAGAWVMNTYPIRGEMSGLWEIREMPLNEPLRGEKG